MEQKKLYKDMRNKMICGICAGLGNYLNMDPNVVRLIFIVLAFAGGLGILLYIAAACILPEQN